MKELKKNPDGHPGFQGLQEDVSLNDPNELSQRLPREFLKKLPKEFVKRIPKAIPIITTGEIIKKKNRKRSKTNF